MNKNNTTPSKIIISDDAIWFTSKSREWSWLSNFSDHSFKLDGHRWGSVEHFYQAQKHIGTPAFDKFRLAPNPLKARKAGQDRSLIVRNDWESAKEHEMSRALVAKFGQNHLLSARLLNTDTRQLIHESGTDRVWGADKEGNGNNLLGTILMDVRDTLKQGGNQ